MHVAVSERGAYSGNSMGMRLLAPHARYQAPRTYGFKHLQHQDLEARSHCQQYPTSLSTVPTSPALVQQVQQVREPLVREPLVKPTRQNYLRSNADTAVLYAVRINTCSRCK